MRRGEGNLKDSGSNEEYLMKSEKRRKKLQCFEARIESGDELPLNFDRTSQSNPVQQDCQNLLYCLRAKEDRFTG
jgi:hypothetical protein